MRFSIFFRFNHENITVAATGVEGDVTDILLPAVGDLVRHADLSGTPFEGRVTERIFNYELAVGAGIDGTISVTLCLERTTIQ